MRLPLIASTTVALLCCAFDSHATLSATASIVPGTCVSSSTPTSATASCTEVQGSGASEANAIAEFGYLRGTAGSAEYPYTLTQYPTASASFSDEFTFEPIPGQPLATYVLFGVDAEALSYSGELSGSIGSAQFQGGGSGSTTEQEIDVRFQYGVPFDFSVTGSAGTCYESNCLEPGAFAFTLDSRILVCSSPEPGECAHEAESVPTASYNVFTESGFNYPDLFGGAGYVGPAAPEPIATPLVAVGMILPVLLRLAVRFARTVRNQKTESMKIQHSRVKR